MWVWARVGSRAGDGTGGQEQADGGLALEETAVTSNYGGVNIP